MDPQDEDSRADRLNTRTFAIKYGERIYVVVPVLVYERNDPRQGAGYTYMNGMFQPGAVAPFQALEIEGAWATFDPHNSRARDPHQADDITAPPPPMPHQAEPSAGGSDDPDDV